MSGAGAAEADLPTVGFRSDGRTCAQEIARINRAAADLPDFAGTSESDLSPAGFGARARLCAGNRPDKSDGGGLSDFAGASEPDFVTVRVSERGQGCARRKSRG